MLLEVCPEVILCSVISQGYDILFCFILVCHVFLHVFPRKLVTWLNDFYIFIFIDIIHEYKFKTLSLQLTYNYFFPRNELIQYLCCLMKDNKYHIKLIEAHTS